MSERLTSEERGWQASGLHHGVGCEPATLGQLGAEVAEGADFLLGGDTGDDVSGEAAHDVGTSSFKLQAADHIANDRGEGIAVVKTERCHLVALATKIYGLSKGHRLCVAGVPKLLRLGVTFRSRFVKGILCLAQGRILQRDKIPAVGGQPRSSLIHRDSLFFPFFDRLKLFDTCTFQKAFAGLAVNRFGDKAILDFQSICQHPLERWIF
jgi:hypothetical protein